MKILKIDKKLRTGRNNGIFHDTRSDVNLLADYCNMISDKINELIDEMEKMKIEKEKEDIK